MGTTSPGTASRGGMREQKRDRNRGEERTRRGKRNTVDRGRWKKVTGIEGERIEKDKQEGRESSKERKSHAEQGKTDVYLSQQTKTREDTQGVI